jgi:hypothetical protein
MSWLIGGGIYGIIMGWVILEFWKAPLMDAKGNIIKNKKKSGSYSELEKLGRGRSKH